MTDYDLGTLFFRPPAGTPAPLIKLSAATYQLGANADAWVDELTELLYREHPYLARLGRVFLQTDAEDRERGYLKGWFMVDNGQDAPLGDPGVNTLSMEAPAEQSGTGGATKKIRIPVLVENRRSYPFSVFITEGNQFLPATEMRLSQALFDTGFAMTAPRSSLMAPQQQAGDSSPWGALPGGAIWNGGSVKTAALQHAAVLGFDGARGVYDVYDVAGNHIHQVPDSALSLGADGLPAHITKVAATEGAVLIGAVGEALPMVDVSQDTLTAAGGMTKVAAGGPGAFPAVLGDHGQPVLGFVVTGPVSIRGEELSVPLAITEKTAALQDGLVARPVKHNAVPTAYRIGDGWEKLAGMTGVIASGGKFTEPVTVEALLPGRTAIVNAGDLRGTVMVKVADFQFRGVLHQDGITLVDKDAEFYPIERRADFDTEEFALTYGDSDTVVKTALLLHTDGAYHLEDSDGVYVPDLNPVETVCALANMGDSPAGISQKMKLARREPEGVRFVLPAATLHKEKVASGAELPDQAQIDHLNSALEALGRLDLSALPAELPVVKTAAISVGTNKKRSPRDTIDAVLDLGFVTPENVRYFSERSSLVESAVSLLAEALVAARMGVPLPEQQIAAAMRAMDRVAQAMSRLRVRLAADAALTATGLTS